MLNTFKTKTLLVTSKRLEKKISNKALKVSQTRLSQKLLGVTLDSHLNFIEHIDELCKKMAQRISVLKKIKRNLLLAGRKLLFNALIKPILLYGSCAWTTATEENVERVFKLQKRAARVILDANLRDRSKDLLDGLIGCRLRRK